MLGQELLLELRESGNKNRIDNTTKKVVYCIYQTESERVNAFSVMECMENNEFDKVLFKRWQKKSV